MALQFVTEDLFTSEWKVRGRNDRHPVEIRPQRDMNTPPNTLLGMECALAAQCFKDFATARIHHNPGVWLSFTQKTDHHAVARAVFGICNRAIDRVDDPDVFSGGRTRESIFFG